MTSAFASIMAAMFLLEYATLADDGRCDESGRLDRLAHVGIDVHIDKKIIHSELKPGDLNERYPTYSAIDRR